MEVEGRARLVRGGWRYMTLKGHSAGARVGEGEREGGAVAEGEAGVVEDEVVAAALVLLVAAGFAADFAVLLRLRLAAMVRAYLGAKRLVGAKN